MRRRLSSLAVDPLTEGESEQSRPGATGSRRPPLDGHRPHEQAGATAPPLDASTWELAWSGYRHRGSMVDAHAKIAEHGHSLLAARRLVYAGLAELGLEPLKARLARESRKAASTEKRMVQAVERVDAKSAARLLEARVQAVREAEERTKLVLGDRATQREEEAKLVRTNRRAHMVLASLNGELLAGSVSLAKRLRVQLESAELSPSKGVALLKDVATIVQRTAEASRASVQMERLILGEPTHVHEHRDSAGATPPKDMTPDEAERWLEVATRHLERRARAATVIDVEASSDLESPAAED